MKIDEYHTVMSTTRGEESPEYGRPYVQKRCSMRGNSEAFTGTFDVLATHTEGRRPTFSASFSSSLEHLPFFEECVAEVREWVASRVK